MKRIAFMCAFALMGGCVAIAPVPSTADFGPRPDQAKAEAFVLERLKPLLKDPDSIKQFSLRMHQTSAFSGTAYGNFWTPGWALCYEYNAKNSYGAYAGIDRGYMLVKVIDGDIYVTTNGIGKILHIPC